MKKLSGIIRFLWMFIYARLLDWWESHSSPHWSAAGNLPPPSLRYRVNGTPDRYFYIWYGKLIWDIISKKINEFVIPDPRGIKILDYGCGCGQMARHIDPTKFRYTGTDIDSVALNWCRNHLGVDRYFRFVDCDDRSLHDRSQHVIVAVSVFSYIPFDIQYELLKRFHRLLETNGVVILIVHGSKAAHANMNHRDITSYAIEGCYYDEPYLMKKYFSLAYYSKWFIQRKCVDLGFKVVEYDEGGLNGWQDVVVLRKR